MATQVQLRRGTSQWHAGFTGAEGEVTVNTDDFGLHVHDGSTAGGHRSGGSLPDIVTAGSATKVQVDSKGRVIVRGNLTAADVPDLPMDKVAGLPTDLAMLANEITALQMQLTDLAAVAGVISFNGRTGPVTAQIGDFAADQITSTAIGGLTATNVQAALAELDGKKLGLPAALPTATAAEGDHVAFADLSNGDAPARTTVGGLFTNRILTAPELRGYTELVAAAVAVNGAHTMGGITVGNVKRYTLTGNVTLTLPAISLNANTGVALSAVLVQDATGGRSVTFAAPAGETILWDGGGSQPTLATGAGQETTFSFYKIAGSSHWKGVRTHKGG